MLAFWIQYSFMIKLDKIIVILNYSELAFEKGMNIQVEFFILHQCSSSHYLDHFLSRASTVYTQQISSSSVYDST